MEASNQKITVCSLHFRRGACLLKIQCARPSSRPIFLLPSHRHPFMDEARYTRYTISCPLVHRGCPWEGAIERKKYLCHMSQFNWLLVVSISFLKVKATCHFLTGSCHFICPGQLPIYSGIPPLPSTFAKFSPLTFLV